MNDEEIKILTDLALRQAVARNDVRVAMTRPYNHENGNTYATDGLILLCIPSSICKEYSPFQDARFPNVVPVIENNIKSASDESHHLMLKHMTDTDCDVNIGGVIVRNSIYRRVKDITCLLGLKGWNVRVSYRSLILENNLIRMLVMGLLDSKRFDLLPFSDEELPEDMDVESAKEYIKVLKEREQKHKEEQDIRSCIYTFTVVRYATMYVKAGSIDEAKNLAHRHRHDIISWDFEDPEIDSYENGPEEPDAGMGTIYTADGGRSYVEVCEQIEKEIELRRG